MQSFDAVTVRHLLSALALVAVALGGTACQQIPAQGAPRGAVLYKNCEPCHGADAMGRPDIEAPAIAGLGAWYITAQVKKFQTGIRGAHADDFAGLRMRPMSKSLRTDEDIAAVAEYVSGLPATKPARTIMDANPGRGGQLYKPCEACHGANGAGSEALNAPRINANYDWYLLKQLEHFKSGVRGAKEGDATGAQMASMVESLPDEQAMKDVVAYIQKLK